MPLRKIKEINISFRNLTRKKIPLEEVGLEF
jgi:hypothetical protein